MQRSQSLANPPQCVLLLADFVVLDVLPAAEAAAKAGGEAAKHATTLRTAVNDTLCDVQPLVA